MEYRHMTLLSDQREKDYFDERQHVIGTCGMNLSVSEQLVHCPIHIVSVSEQLVHCPTHIVSVSEQLVHCPTHIVSVSEQLVHCPTHIVSVSEQLVHTVPLTLCRSVSS